MYLVSGSVLICVVEMREARRRALTHLLVLLYNQQIFGRNERSPKKGIDTSFCMLPILHHSE